MRKLLALLSLLVVAGMILTACGPTTTGTGTTAGAGGVKSKDPTTFVSASFGEAETLDPALDYESAGIEIIQNVYESLIFFEGEYVDRFVPVLATDYTVSDDALTYTFTIRQGVKFHDGADMTPSDVAYSYHRGLLYGGYSGPQWLFAEPFFGVGLDDITYLVDDGASADDPEALQAADPAVLVAACEKVKSLIVADDENWTVTMTLAQPWGPFLATVAGTWGSVMDQDWTVANGGWDGSCDTWQNYYAVNSEDDPLTAMMNGTGPFMFDHWTPGDELVLVRNDNYWREPAKLERVIFKQVDEWGTRFSMLQAGDADWAVVPVENRSQVDAMVGEECIWNFDTSSYDCEVTDETQPMRRYLGRPTLSVTDIFLVFQIANPDGTNIYLGSGKLDGNGVPADFFSDLHIRRAFSYCFDWDTFINDIFNGEAVQRVGVALPGMVGYEADGPKFSYDLEKCAEEFKLADLDHDGIAAGDDTDDVWEVGFQLLAGYNAGNTTRQAIIEILAASLLEVNEKFEVSAVGLPWPAYLRMYRASMLPMFVTGWIEDIHDSHNWYGPYLLTTFASRQKMPAELKAQYADYVAQGAVGKTFEERAAIYHELNQVIFDTAPQVYLVNSTSHGFIQRYVHGLVLNPLYAGFNYYPIYKD